MKLTEMVSTDTQKLLAVKNWMDKYRKGIDPDMTEATVLRDIFKTLKKKSIEKLKKWVEVQKNGSDKDMVQWKMADELEKLIR